jgi:hypothetical protein
VKNGKVIGEKLNLIHQPISNPSSNMKSDFDEFKKMSRVIMQFVVLVVISFTILKEIWGTFGTVVGVISFFFFVIKEYNNKPESK